jgi:peptide-methionine (S)-S-oxide reductase
MVLLFVTVFQTAKADNKTQSAILAGGCFWCIEADYEKLDGVQEVVSGYIGGHTDNPTYAQVSSGNSGHIEAAVITYDSKKLDYTQILDFFWKNIDPTNDQGQFCDFGPQYRPAIFYENDEQKKLAMQSIQKVKDTKPFSGPVKVELLEATEFYPAEEYHQDYYKKNPFRYKFYRISCGRDARLEELWGKP